MSKKSNLPKVPHTSSATVDGSGAWPTLPAGTKFLTLTTADGKTATVARKDIDTLAGIAGTVYAFAKQPGKGVSPLVWPAPKATAKAPSVPAKAPKAPKATKPAPKAPKAPKGKPAAPATLPGTAGELAKLAAKHGTDTLHKSGVKNPVEHVWNTASANPEMRRKDVIDLCVAQGVAFYTARTQYQLWKAAGKTAPKA